MIITKGGRYRQHAYRHETMPKTITITERQLLTLLRGTAPSRQTKLSVKDLVRLSGDAGPDLQLSIREAIRATLEEHGELKSRDINYHLKRDNLPLATASTNLPALVQTTLGTMQANKEVIRRGKRGRSTYRLAKAA